MYCENMKNYMSYMAPVITNGKVRHEQEEYKKKIVTRNDLLDDIEEEFES